MIPPLRILVAEDEPHIRDYVETILQRMGPASISLVGNGEAAIEALQREEWDLVISDQRMGPTDGLEVLKVAAQLRPGARRMMMTGFAELPLLEEALNRAHVERFVAKPFSPGPFLKEVQALLDDVRLAEYRDQAFERAGSLARDAQPPP